MQDEFRSGKQRLVFTREGEGSHRLVFLHGLCGTKELWLKQAAAFRGEFEVVCVDLLGHGASSEIGGRDLIGANAAILREYLERDGRPATVIGHSLGGIVASEVACVANCAARVVFVDSPCLALPEKLAWYNEYAEKLPAEEDPVSYVREWFEGLLTEDVDPEIRETVVNEAVRRDTLWLAEAMGGLKAPRKSACDPQSVFVMEGVQYFGEDKSLSWHQLYAGARGWLYPGQGHFFFLEDPEPFNAALAGFLTASGPVQVGKK